MAESEYLLSNVDPETVERFGGLEETFDPVSVGHLRRCIGAGARCLETGAGGGSVARWMAAEVGPTGGAWLWTPIRGGSSMTAARTSRCAGSMS
jgi:hypothetical protein